MATGPESGVPPHEGSVYKYLDSFFASDHADYESNADVVVLGGEVWEVRERMLPRTADAGTELWTPSVQSEDSLVTLARAAASGVIEVAFSLASAPDFGPYRRYRFREDGRPGELWFAAYERNLEPLEQAAIGLIIKDSRPLGF